MKKLFLLAASLFFLAGCNTNIDNSSSTETEYFTVNFDSNGGSEVESQRVLSGNPLREPEPPYLEGHFINGWYREDDLSIESKWNFEIDRVYQNMTLYAGWTANDIEDPTEGLIYELNEDNTGYVITDYEGDDAYIIIPEEHEGLPVVEIQGEYGTGAFAREHITSVVISDNIERIGQNSFNNCSSLTSVEISSNSHLTEIGNNAFSGCGELESIFLPRGLNNIGDAAFNNCGAINEFIVAEENETFRSENGHLIDNATNTIIRGANNPNIPNGIETIGQASFRRSEISELNIPVSVNAIENYVISDSEIVQINYEGNEEEWGSITKARLWNLGKEDITINYSVLDEQEGDTLIAYFSRTGESYDGSMIERGNVDIFASYISDLIDNETMFKINPLTPYPENYDEMISIARDEWNNDARPEIASNIASIDQYDNIFIGYPIWNGHTPRIIHTFLDSFDFSNKNIIPFSTAGSSSMNGSVNELRNEYPSYNFEDGLRITDGTIHNEESSKSQIENWLEEIGFEVSQIEYIYLNLNDKKYQIKINDNASSRDLLSRLPLVLSFSNFSTNEKIAYLDESLDVNEGERGAEAKKGELNYYIPWGNLCLFYEDGNASNSLINIGFMEEGIEDFASMNSNFTATLTIN